MDALLDEEVVVDVDLTLDVRCEVPDHYDPMWSYMHGGPGEFMGILPCGVRAIVCRPIRDRLVSKGWATCSNCGHHQVTSSNFIPL